MNNKKLFALSVAALTTVAGLMSCGGGGGGGTGYKYTYNTYLDANPKTWNPHTWETNSDSYILAYTEMGLYDLGFNETKDGYEFLCEMASALPKDVTSELTREEKERYFGRATINLNSGIAWDIKLNEAATWQDGTKITATDYVESMKRLLDPRFVNHRADSWYKGNSVLANAEAYFKNGQTTIEAAYDYLDGNCEIKDDRFGIDDEWFVNLGGHTPYAEAIFSNGENFYQVLNNRGTRSTDAVEDAAKRITDSLGEALIKVRRDGYLGDAQKSSDWVSVETASDIKTEGEHGNMWDYSLSENDIESLDLKVYDYNDGKRTYKRIVPEAELDHDGKDLPEDWEEYSWEDLRKDISTFVKGLGTPVAARKENSWRLPLFGHYQNDTIDLPFEKVGIAKINDYTVRLIMDPTSAISENDLKFALTSNWIVKTDLYDKLSGPVAGTDLYATKYGTAGAENYMSYGPYKLTQFQSNKLIMLERNENWYGYKDGQHNGQFQMEALDTQIVEKHETAMALFESGEIDDIELTASDMKTYGNSSRIQFTPTSYTQKLSFNITRESLLTRQNNQASGHSGNKTILANEDFRKAVALSIDRNQYASQCTAGSKGFTGLLNDLYISDVDTGEGYRTTAQAKSVYNKIYGHLGGSNIDEEHGEALPESRTGYNLPLAAKYLARAIETENASEENGHFSKGQTVSIEILVYKTDSETTQASYKFIKDGLNALANQVNLAAGENVINFDYFMTQNEDYYTEAKKGHYDVIFSTWGGAQMNPWGLMEVYCDSTFDSNCEYGMTKKVNKIQLSFDFDGDGREDTKTIEGWYKFLSEHKEISAADYDLEDPEEAEQYALDKVRRHKERLNILSELEAGYLNTWSTTPVISRSSASLTSFKVQFATTNYIPLMGYGGVRYMTFNFTDSEWAQKIASGEINKDSYKQ